MDDLIKVYGAGWCPDCRRAKRFLGDQRIPFEWHDIEVDPDGVRTVQERNDGNDIIPTIIFPDGSHLSEPSNEELAEKIGLERTAMMHVYDLIIIGSGLYIVQREQRLRLAARSTPSATEDELAAADAG